MSLCVKRKVVLVVITDMGETLLQYIAVELVFELILQGVPLPSHTHSVCTDNCFLTGGVQFVCEL